MFSALILYTCLATGGGCHMKVVADNVPYFTCPIAGQIEGAKYVAQHPKRKIVGWKCVDPRRLPFFLHRDEA